MHDYFAIPRSLLPVIFKRTRNAPLSLSLDGHTLDVLRSRTVEDGAVVHFDFLHPSVSRAEELRLLSFTMKTFQKFERWFQTPRHNLRRLTIDMVTREQDGFLVLPEALCSSRVLTYLELDGCLPERWTSPIFSSYLTHLILRLSWIHDGADYMPTAVQFADILAATNSLESLELEDVFPKVDPEASYPPMVVPDTLHSLVLLSLNGITRKHQCLSFMARLRALHDIHFEALIFDHTGANADDVVIARELDPLVITAVCNMYRQQPGLPRHAIIDQQALLTFNSRSSRSPERAWPLSLEPDTFADIPDATSLLAFNFDAGDVEEDRSRPLYALSVPLHGLETISWTREGARVYLESNDWWRASREARGIDRISVHVGDCALLLPLTERVAENATAFIIFPKLKTMHIRVEDPYTVDDTELNALQDACAENLAALHAIIRLRKEHGAQLDSLVVDEALERWAIWSAISADLSNPVTFCAFDSYMRSTGTHI
ncbi:unnamed protein product [Peniophora sp. CBMAI 1063]|nr:unnamed protein product [Peniophora sp. CBMAI 1063]